MTFDMRVVELKPLLEDAAVLKIAQNLKYDFLIFMQRGIRVAPFDDTMLISYILESGLHGHGMDELSELHLQHKAISFSEVAGKGKEKITFDQVPIKDATRYSAEDADVTFRLYLLLKPRLAVDGKTTAYETLERPLVPVLADMERAGIKIDPDLLRKLSNDFAQEQAKLERGLVRMLHREPAIVPVLRVGVHLEAELAHVEAERFVLVVHIKTNYSDAFAHLESPIGDQETPRL